MTAQDRFQAGHKVMGRYEIVRHIATGGMGTVWEARDLTLDQAVALKHVGFATLPGPDAEQTRKRTLREARFAAQLRGHHHVVSIYDVQEVDGDVWLVLEYLPSSSLADVTEGGRTLPVAEAARVGAAVADALAAAHDRGITHRDVKPGNVLLAHADGEVKLTDFGISHAEGEHPLTALDVVSGTPAYMSREVARGDEETPASDVFSLGATLYKAVEGQPPFGEDSNSRRMLQRVANGHIEPPRRAGPFAPLLMHLLELDPSTRPDAAQAHRLLDDFARRHRDPTRPPSSSSVPLSPYPPRGPASAPSTHIPSRPGSRPARPRRRRALLAGAAVVLVAALVAGGAALFWPRDASAIPAIPESVDTGLAVTGDPKAADPCPLLDPVVMARFGGPVTIGAGQRIGVCRLTNAPVVNSRPVVTDAYFSSDSVELEQAGSTSQDLGGLRIIRQGLTPNFGCVSYLRFRDGSQVSLGTKPRYSDDPVPNLCEIHEAAIAVAVNELAENGITYTPGWQGRIGLAAFDACTLPGEAPREIPLLAADLRQGYPNGSVCYIGAQGAGLPYVVVNLGLEESGNLSGYGTAGTAEGKTVYTSRATPIGGGPNSCDVYLVHRPSYDKGASGPAEYINVQLDGPQPFEQLCRQATQVALAAERNT